MTIDKQPVVNRHGAALTRMICGDHQCLRCGRFAFERCNGSGLSRIPCELARGQAATEAVPAATNGRYVGLDRSEA